MGIPDRTIDESADIPVDVWEAVMAERDKQKEWGADFDRSNSRNDWIAYITSYAGDAAAKVRKKELQGADDDVRFTANMLKIAALAVAAIEAHEKGYC